MNYLLQLLSQMEPLSLEDTLWVVGCHYKLRYYTIQEDLFKVCDMWLLYECLLLRS